LTRKKTKRGKFRSWESYCTSRVLVAKFIEVGGGFRERKREVEVSSLIFFKG
jgi:hypothetical protein